MPRGPRFDIPGIVYHVICRGIERREIFKDARDYHYLLARLSYLTGGGEAVTYAFCLMPNHIHLLVKPLRTNLATLMRRLLTSYAIYFNKRHKRAGHLFQNRYASFSVQEAMYFLELLRYIHLNPVKASIVKDLASLSHWPYSGYAALMGKTVYQWFEVGETLLLFAEKKNNARRILTQFMKEGLLEAEADRPIEDSLKQCYLTEAGADSKRIDVLERHIIGDSAFAEQA